MNVFIAKPEQSFRRSVLGLQHAAEEHFQVLRFCCGDVDWVVDAVTQSFQHLH